MPKAAFDPISLEIHWARLISMVDEAAAIPLPLLAELTRRQPEHRANR